MVRKAGLIFFVMTNAALAQDPVWEPNTVEFLTERIGDGVYALIPSDAAAKGPQGLPIPTTAGFVVGQRGVLLIETGLNEHVYGRIEAAVRSVTDKPILYAVNTSFHGDHSYGNRFLPEDTRLIQHVRTDEYIRANLEEDKRFMLGLFGEGRGIEDAIYRPADILIPPGGSHTLDLGGKEVVIRDFGFAQTGGDLFVWQPEARALWAGNGLLAEKPALPWLLGGHATEVLATSEAVRVFLPPGSTIVPGHGATLGRDGFDWQIAYLRALIEGVRRSVGRGDSLDAAKEAVGLPAFADYALFDWVHYEVNLPAAYEEARASR